MSCTLLGGLLWIMTMVGMCVCHHIRMLLLAALSGSGSCSDAREILVALDDVWALAGHNGTATDLHCDLDIVAAH